VRRFLAWVEATGVKVADIAPGQVGQYLASLVGMAAKRNLHLSTLRDRAIPATVAYTACRAGRSPGCGSAISGTMAISTPCGSSRGGQETQDPGAA
jgi:hypothetical protein